MLKRVLFAVLFLFLAAQLVLAHNLWIEKRDGNFVLLYGHGTKFDPYDPQKVKEAKSFDAKGHVLPVERGRQKEGVTFQSKGTPAILTAFLDNGCWIKTTDGWKNIGRREVKGKYTIVDAIRSWKYAKALLTPCGIVSKPAGLDFEIVPEKDPFLLKPGEALPVKVLLHGKPLEGVVISHSDAGHSSKDGLKTDKNGKANVVISKSGAHLIIGVYDKPLKDDPDVDRLLLATSLTFELK